MATEDTQLIHAPTLIIIGNGDNVRPEHAVELFRLFSYAQLAVFPGTGHHTFVKRRDRLLSMLSEFLDAPVPEPVSK